MLTASPNLVSHTAVSVETDFALRHQVCGVPERSGHHATRLGAQPEFGGLSVAASEMEEPGLELVWSDAD